MSKLIYSFLASLDGYIADDAGGFEWAVRDEVLDFINAAERDVGTYLYGRTMYETMIGWENDPAVAGQSPKSAEFAQIWQAAEKVVFSRSLESVSTKRTRIERSFDRDLVRAIKAEASRDLNVSGADVAASAWRAGLVDECHVFVAPMLVRSSESRRWFRPLVRYLFASTSSENPRPPAASASAVRWWRAVPSPLQNAATRAARPYSVYSVWCDSRERLPARRSRG